MQATSESLGFDDYYGVPYNDDMTARPGRNWPPLPLIQHPG